MKIALEFLTASAQPVVVTEELFLCWVEEYAEVSADNRNKVREVVAHSLDWKPGDR